MHLASATANALWKSGGTGKDDIDRPVFAVFLGSDNELQAFGANLRLGRLVQDVPDQPGYSHRQKKSGYEFLRSAGYRQARQQTSAGSILTVYLPDLFNMDPGMVDPEGARFVLAPSAAWVASQEIPTGDLVKHARKLPIVRAANKLPEEKWKREHFKAPLPDDKLAAMAPIAYLFAAYLDRRTRAPILADGRFYMQIMLACLSQDYASWSTASASKRSSYDGAPFGENGDLGFVEDYADGSGLLPGLAFQATHEQIEAVLADEVESYYQIIKGK